MTSLLDALNEVKDAEEAAAAAEQAARLERETLDESASKAFVVDRFAAHGFDVDPADLRVWVESGGDKDAGFQFEIAIEQDVIAYGSYSSESDRLSCKFVVDGTSVYWFCLDNADRVSAGLRECAYSVEKLRKRQASQAAYAAWEDAVPAKPFELRSYPFGGVDSNDCLLTLECLNPGSVTLSFTNLLNGDTVHSPLRKQDMEGLIAFADGDTEMVRLSNMTLFYATNNATRLTVARCTDGTLVTAETLVDLVVEVDGLLDDLALVAAHLDAHSTWLMEGEAAGYNEY